MKYTIVGNWKMNKNIAEAMSLAGEIVSELKQQIAVNVVICPPFTALSELSKLVEKSTVVLGAQNMHYETSGAYTGEVSAEMLRDFFVGYVIIGHSERRQYFNETDETVNKKVHAALNGKLRPIMCVGETLAERESGNMLTVIERQVKAGIRDLSENQLDRLLIAYEPVWAIGTGKTASPEMAQEVHQAIRSIVASVYSSTIASRIPILYGGSMKESNARSLLEQADINGGLIGGAALDAKSFIEIVEAAAGLHEVNAVECKKS